MSVTWSVVALPGRANRLVVKGSVDLGAEQPLVDAVTHIVEEASDDAHGDDVGDEPDDDPDVDAPTCEIDLTGVSFIDSSGVRALMRLARSFGPRVTVGAVSDPVERVLEIAGVRDWLSAATTEPDDDASESSGGEPTPVGDAGRAEGRT